MSDQTQQPSPAVANAQQALAIKGVNDRIDGLKSQIKTLWIVVVVIGLIALLGAFFTLAPRLGLRIGGGFAGRGTFNGQQFNGNGGPGFGNGTGGGTQQAPQTPPAQ